MDPVMADGGSTISCIRFPDDEGTETWGEEERCDAAIDPAFASPMTRGLKQRNRAAAVQLLVGLHSLPR